MGRGRLHGAMVVVTVGVMVAGPFGLTGCNGELVEDTGYACIVTGQTECPECYGDITHTVCEGWLANHGPVWADYCSDAPIEPMTPHRVEVVLGDGRGESWDIQCSIEEVGDRELEVRASYRWREHRDHQGRGALIAICETPPLEPGEWKMRYADGTVAFVVGSEPEPIACVHSGRDN